MGDLVTIYTHFGGFGCEIVGFLSGEEIDLARESTASTFKRALMLALPSALFNNWVLRGEFFLYCEKNRRFPK